MAVQRWELYDPTNAETWVLPLNPSEGGAAPRKKSITTEGTTASDGQVVVFEGPDEVRIKEWKGTIYDEATFREWERWFAKRHQIRLIDDIDVEWWIYIRDFEPERVRSALYPWKHRYTVRAIVFSGG